MAERFQHESVHNEAGFHIGNPRPEGLVAFYPEGSLSGGAVGEDRIAVPHQHDRPIAASTGKPRRHAIAENITRIDFAGNVRSFEKGPQPVAHRVDAGLVVTARVDVYEIGQQADHRLMLPTEMLDNGGLYRAAHGSTPTWT